MRRLVRLGILMAVACLPRLCMGGEPPMLAHWQLAEEELYVYRFDMDALNWHQIREERQRRSTIQEDPKQVVLR